MHHYFPPTRRHYSATSIGSANRISDFTSSAASQYWFASMKCVSASLHSRYTCSTLGDVPSAAVCFSRPAHQLFLRPKHLYLSFDFHSHHLLLLTNAYKKRSQSFVIPVSIRGFLKYQFAICTNFKNYFSENAYGFFISNTLRLTYMNVYNEKAEPNDTDFRQQTAPLVSWLLF